MELFNFDETFVSFSLKQLFWDTTATVRACGGSKRNTGDCFGGIGKTFTHQF